MMKSYLDKLRGELTPEQEILRNRLVMGSVSGVSCFFFAFDAVIFSAFFAYLSLNAALYTMQKYNVWRPEERWLAAIILDVMMAFVVMLREPEHMAIFYPIILWMILGNGFRYGLKWLFVASILSTATFGIVVLSTGYWQQHEPLGLALALALLVIPAYCSTLIRKISHAKEQAEAASKAKSYFLASVSHELRTPLNAIIGYGNHLRHSEMPRNQKEMVEASVLAGEHLLHLIEQLIEVAKSGTGSAQIKTSAFRPTDLLTEIRDIMAVRVDDKGLAFHLQAQPLTDRVVNGPGDVVRNIVLNLIGNAVKFTEAGSISINGGIVTENGTDHLWITVSDTGIGIAEAAVDRIFQPFQQADDTVLNRFGGTGLGLSICTQLVEQVDGTISVESVIGQGSTFRIQVPVEIENVEEDTQIALGSANANTVKILSFGDLQPDLLASAQSEDSFTLRHLRCADASGFVAALDSIELADFSVALIAQDLALQVGAESGIWQRFADAEIAPVLVSNSDKVSLEDVALRAAFASILPPSPNFDELRSAVRIGCSFARQFRLPHDDGVPSITIYSPKRVLVADDNRTNRNVLEAILKSAGHDVSMATDGDEALQMLEQGGFDILLLDVNMPRLNGIDACSMWRQIEGGRQHLPIVGVTADATSETELRCRNAGMDLRITKPVDAKLLLATIEQLCGTPNDDVLLSTSSDPRDVVVPFSGPGKLQQGAIDAGQLDYLMSIGDSNFVRSMIEGFFEDVDQMIDPLRKSVADNDVPEFRFCVHAFKSSGNNMGAKRLATLCGHLEKITEADFAEHKYVYLDKVEQEVESAVTALNELAQQQCMDTPLLKIKR